MFIKLRARYRAERAARSARDRNNAKPYRVHGIQIIIGFGSPARARADDEQINRISNAAKSAQFRRFRNRASAFPPRGTSEIHVNVATSFAFALHLEITRSFAGPEKNSKNIFKSTYRGFLSGDVNDFMR